MIEQQPQNTIMILGKNIGVEWDGERIRKTPGHLSTWSEVGADSGGIAIENKYAEVAIFTVGNTAGNKPLTEEEARLSDDVAGTIPLPEADYMNARFQREFPHLAARGLTQPRSHDTFTDAKEARRLIDNGEINEDYLLLATIGFHLARAEMLFRKQGIKCNSIPTEELIGLTDPDRERELKASDLYKKEQKKERTIRIVQSLPWAPEVISAITSRSRN